MTPDVLSVLRSVLPQSQTWIVGGAVRDRLIKKNTTDLDLIVPENAEQYSKKIASRFATHSFVLDGDRGVYRIVLPSVQLDIADFQGKSFENDLSRRDFSINAFACPLKDWSSPSWKKAVVDLHGGLADLKKQCIRSISKKAFDDDPLRLLRAFRFSAELGFEIEASTRKLISQKSKLIKKPAPERVREELMKLFSVLPCHRTVLLMEQCSLLEALFPESKKLRETAPGYYGKGGVLKHTLDSLDQFESILCDLRSWFPKAHKKIQDHLIENVSGFPRMAHLKWAVLLHDVGKPSTAKMIDGRMRFFEHDYVGAEMVNKMKDRYRWSNEETDRYSRLVRHHMRPGNLAVHPEASEKAFHRFFRDLGDDAVGMLLVSLGDHLSYLTPSQRKKRCSAHEVVTIKMMNTFFLQKEKVLPPRLINGYDVIRSFQLKPSPVIGQMLADVLDAQAEGKIKTKKEALSFLKKRLGSYRQGST